jgi:hypothetical protein
MHGFHRVLPYGQDPQASLRRCGTEVSRVRGRLLYGVDHAGSPRRDCSRWGLRPNPIGSDTPCRGLAATEAGVATARFELAFASRFRTGATRFRLSPVPGEGRLTRPSAKENVLRCTRGAFRLRTSPLGEGLFIHNLSPGCGLRALRLFNPRAFRHPDEGGRTAKTRP